MNQIVMQAQALQSELVSCRNHLHQNPEIGMDLPKTSAFVKEKLEAMGYEPQSCAGSGVVALAGGKKPGKVILLRADMDALPVIEEADVECKSCNQFMHACGHDMHTTMLLGAAKLLKEHEDEIEGTVKLMFQPAEETLQGAKAMIEDGVLENPRVDAAVMFHVATGYPAPTGLLVVPGAGPFSAASDRIEIDIQGKGGHGAMPESTVDPLIVASHIHLALQEIKSREIGGSENVVLTIGQIEGGSTYNVIPDTAHMKGTLRTFNPELRLFIHERIKEIAETVAKAFRAEATVKIITGCPSVINDKAVVQDMKTILSEAFSPQMVPDVSLFGMTKLNGSEDFSFVTQEVPSVMLLITAGNSKEGYLYPQHHPKAKFDPKALAVGAAAYANIGIEWLKKNK